MRGGGAARHPVGSSAVPAALADGARRRPRRQTGRRAASADRSQWRDRTIRLARWEPLLTFEVKHHLLRVLKTAMTRKDADRPALIRRVEQLHSELTVLDPARAVTL